MVAVAQFYNKDDTRPGNVHVRVVSTMKSAPRIQVSPLAAQTSATLLFQCEILVEILVLCYCFNSLRAEGGGMSVSLD